MKKWLIQLVLMSSMIRYARKVVLGPLETICLSKEILHLPFQKALHMRALRTFTDEAEETRRNGEEWLITSKDTEAHIPNVYEEVGTMLYLSLPDKRAYG